MAQNPILSTQALPSVLYDCHLRLTNKSHIVPFAGYLMPLWYSSISAEHEAVRETAGMFDCTHMGVLEISSSKAEDFLNIIATNDASSLRQGQAQYSYILDANGQILDDIIVYRRGDENFMVVVNAANEPKIKAYLKHLQNESTVIDGAHPECQLSKNVHVRDMRDTRTGDDCRVDIALQGPKSIELLLPLVGDSREALEKLQTFCFIEEQIDGIDCIISRTGYTGAKISFELFVHPDNAAVLWQKLLDSGENLGILPCGLGARDSLRIEAGLPLYGHELAGDFDISPFEAGYGWAVKLEKEFFIGKEAATEQAENFDMQVARIELSGQKGVRPVRQNDCIVVDNKCIGWILSSAKAKDTQIGLAYMKKDVVVEGNKLTVHYMPRKAGENERIELGEDVQGDIEGKILKRFAKF